MANSAREASLEGLVYPEDPAEPWFVEQPSARGTSFLVGAVYTLTNGQSLSAEYLRYDQGYSSTESSMFFDRAKSAATLLNAAKELKNSARPFPFLQISCVPIISISSGRTTCSQVIPIGA
jgi:hypothetical protein